ncbi:hypothetical protein GGD81_002828 [Rhodobium orientis]|uniref:hypothetical protein n=1 Tax=Rhodobium orientis TaxID=34017 RepID=UPI0011B945B2|nr:hypothetical protein [Rhodobium orientis]MBB4303776.1 hypothetical protein [Rhodobium orientis]
MSKIWNGKTIEWKRPNTWVPLLSRWIRPHLNERGIRYLQRFGYQEICWDDSEWLGITQSVLNKDIEFVVQDFAEAVHASTIRTFHGCRPVAPRTYHEDGIMMNNPRALEEQARRLVYDDETLTSLRPSIEKEIIEYIFRDQDQGNVFVVLDDRFMISSAGHYLIYGSEWLVGLLGPRAHSTLRNRGYPTIFVVDLPLNLINFEVVKHLFEALLQEWTRIKVNRPSWIPEKNFSFCLHQDIPSSMIVTHYHPKLICDPLYNRIVRQNEFVSCPDCNSI